MSEQPSDQARGEQHSGETLYSRVGGRAFFTELVERFYGGVASDPILRPMYPRDLEPAKERLALFLMQYFDGPRDYDARRGHPRLRLRHQGFPIDADARDAWLEHMQAALDVMALDEADRDVLWNYLRDTAEFLRNRGGLSFIGTS